MFDLDFNFYKEIPLETIVLNLKTKKRLVFSLEKENKQISKVIKTLPKKDEVFKMLSGKNGFSSIAVIDYVASKEEIKELYVSTFRIGKKQIDILDELKISKAMFITSELNTKDSDKYDYYNHALNICKKNKWKLISTNNHTKIILMKTKENYYVVETSSNLNENPKMEQYSFENDKKLFKFYKDFFNSFREVKDGKKKRR